MNTLIAALSSAVFGNDNDSMDARDSDTIGEKGLEVDNESGRHSSSGSDELSSAGEIALARPTVTKTARTKVTRVSVIDLAPRLFIDAKRPSMIERGTDEERRTDALEGLTQWKHSSCGCGLHGGKCFSFLRDIVGITRIENNRTRRYDISKKAWLQELTEMLSSSMEIRDADGGTRALVCELSMKVHGHTVCLDAWCHAYHVSLDTVKPLARDVARAQRCLPIAPRRRRRVGAEERRQCDKAAHVRSWAFHRVLALAQPAPNLARKGGNADDDDGMGELQMRRRDLCCRGCSHLKRGSRRSGACNPATCEFGVMCQEITVSEEQTAGKSVFKREYEAARIDAGVALRENLSVNGDCYMCAMLDAEVRVI